MTAALALMSICDGSLTLGSSNYTVRELARDGTKSSLFFSNFLVSRIVLSILAIAIGLSIRWTIDGSSGINVVLFAGTYVLARNVLEYCRVFYRAREVFQYEAYSTILEKFLVVSFGSYALYLTPDAASALMGMTLGMAIAFSLNLGWVKHTSASFRLSLVSKSFYVNAMPEAIPLGLSSIFVLLYYRTDSIMIEAFEGEMVTGQYAIAFRVTEAMILLPYIINSVLLPRLSSLFNTNYSEFVRLSQRSVLSLGALGLAASLIVFAFSPLIVRLIDGSPEAFPAVALLQIMVWSFAIGSLNQMISTVLIASNRQNRLAAILGTAALVNISLNLLLIPTYSATGAATATIITQIVIGILLLTTMSRRQITG